MYEPLLSWQEISGEFNMPVEYSFSADRIKCTENHWDISFRDLDMFGLDGAALTIILLDSKQIASKCTISKAFIRDSTSATVKLSTLDIFMNNFGLI